MHGVEFAEDSATWPNSYSATDYISPKIHLHWKPVLFSRIILHTENQFYSEELENAFIFRQDG